MAAGGHGQIPASSRENGVTLKHRHNAQSGVLRLGGRVDCLPLGCVAPDCVLHLKASRHPLHLQKTL